MSSLVSTATMSIPSLITMSDSAVTICGGQIPFGYYLYLVVVGREVIELIHLPLLHKSSLNVARFFLVV